MIQSAANCAYAVFINADSGGLFEKRMGRLESFLRNRDTAAARREWATVQAAHIHELVAVFREKRVFSRRGVAKYDFKLAEFLLLMNNV